MDPAPHSSLSLLFFPCVPAVTSHKLILKSGCCPSSSLHYWDTACIIAICLISPTFSLWLIIYHMVGVLQTLDHL